MRKNLSILATIAGAAHLAAGIGLLAFQNEIKTAMGYGTGYDISSVKVYPVQNVLELMFMGIPCVVPGILSMSESLDYKRGVDLLLIIYSGLMLVLDGLSSPIGSFLNNFIVSRTMGVEGMVNISIVSAVFGWIHFLIDLSLVLLLLRGALSLGANTQLSAK